MRHSNPAESAGRRSRHSGQHPPNRTNLAVKSKFTEKRDTFQGSTGIAAAAPKMAMAIPRSNPLPRLGRLAG